MHLCLALISMYIVVPNIAPVNRGFICDDSALKYTYYSNTIEITLVHLTGYLLLLVTVGVLMMTRIERIPDFLHRMPAI